jgi:nitroreductase
MRTPESNKLHKMFIDRWSPRSFLSDPISEEDIRSLFEAARWAPSCFNEQPHYFVFARDKKDLELFQSVLMDTNRAWAKMAPLLVIVFSKRRFDKTGKENRWADFDAGSAFMSLVLQAHDLGLSCHGMGGFDQEKAYEVTGVNKEEFNAICVVAIGKKGSPDALPEQLRERETPSGRKPLREVFAEAIS